MTPLDHNALRTHQAVLIGFLVAAFLSNSAGAVAVVALLMFAGTLLRRPAFLPVYRLLRGLGWLAPDPKFDRPEPHRFAHLLGTLFLLAAVLVFVLGQTALGWGLTLLVALLAGVNLFLGFCLGCAMYYWLARLGVPAFHLRPDTEKPITRSPSGRA